MRTEMEAVDLLMATFGARRAVERCITSLLDVDAGHPFHLTVFDNLASEQDGTREFLKTFAGDMDRKTPNSGDTNRLPARTPGLPVHVPAAASGPCPLTVVFSAENMGHGHCLDYLVTRTHNPIIVALDSDLVFTPQAAGWLRAIVETLSDDVKICGDVTHALRPDAFAGVWLPRVLPMVLGADRKFL